MAELAAPLTLTATVEFGGREVPGPFGAPVAVDTDRATGAPMAVVAGTHECDARPWRLRVTVAPRPASPRLAVTVAVSPRDGDELVVRNLLVRFALADAAGWHVEAPGNMIRPGVEVASLEGDVAVLGPGHMLGSPGLAALHRPDGPTVVVWPFSREDPANATVCRDRDGVVVEVDTHLAGVTRPGRWLGHGPIYVDAIDRPWSDVVGEIAEWYEPMGLRTPPDRPAWTTTVSLFEVMVGAAPFHGGVRYEPFPTITDLVADLDRIAALGFDCLQLMPRHPYPSYNIHQPGDVATTYGDPADVRRLVDECHRRGLRIIFDVLLHGVVDNAVVSRTLAHVEQGPYAGRLGEPCHDLYDPDSEIVSWSRHIVEFASAWIDGSPERHPLLDEHPEWFMRNSAGEIVGRYTNALDVGNREWQNHFIEACASTVRAYGIDGFRIDAPLYNCFPNWSAATRHHASSSNLGALELLRRLRERLRAERDDVLLLSEPGGALARESLDLCYSYEERWLPGAVFDPRQRPTYDWRRVRTGAELARWFRDYDAALPPGSVSAHYIDVHDTMWWLLPGDWWRREQIGPEATKAALVIHALRGGAYMTFVGGEASIEDELTRVHELRRRVPALGPGAADYDAVCCTDDAVYCVVRRAADSVVLVAVNTSDRRLTATCRLRADASSGPGVSAVADLWNGGMVDITRQESAATSVSLEFEPFQPYVLGVPG